MIYAPGYVKVWRSLLEWEWYHDDRCVRLLLHLNLKSNYTDRRWRGQDLKPGQLITSAQSLAEQLKWSRSAVNRTLDKLRDSGEVTTEADNRWTLVTLVKWGQLQSDEENPDSKANSKRTTDEAASGQRAIQQADTAEEGNKGRSTPNGVLIVGDHEKGVEVVIVETPTLFGTEGDPARTSIMRNSPVADWEIFRLVPEAVQLIGLGVDVAHYHGALLRWSDTKNRTVRTAQGWVSTVISAMHRDKNEGKLRMLNGQSDKDERLMKFLKIGSKR